MKTATPRTASALESHIRCVIFTLYTTHPFNSSYKSVSSLPRGPHNTKALTFPFPVLVSPLRLQNHAHSDLYDTSYLSYHVIRLFPQWANAASWTSSPFTKTSGRATPAGPAHLYGLWALEQVGFDQSSLLLSSLRSSARCGWRNS